MVELGNLQELSNLTFRNTEWGSTTKGSPGLQKCIALVQ